MKVRRSWGAPALFNYELLRQANTTCLPCQLTARKASGSICAYYHPARRRYSSWRQAASLVSNVLSNAVAQATTKEAIGIDPLRIMAKEMNLLTGSIRQLLGSGHPLLDTVAKYYTQAEGKHLRPMIVLLMSRATASSPKYPRALDELSSLNIDDSISPPSIISDIDPSSPTLNLFTRASTPPSADSDILPSQRRLAEIIELIHTASLLHDDVIDRSTSRRGAPSANLEFGNKMAVLAGDFLLSRASVALARLRNAEVTELIASVIANLVEGEFMQLKNTALDEKKPVWTEDTMEYYLQKTYFKTASLISKSCRATALLSASDLATVDAAYLYGKNLGLAFQLVDDMLDYTISERELGKPAGADLALGLATAPLLFAWKDNPELGSLVGRKFSREGDVQKARSIVLQSDGLKQTRDLAGEYVNIAISKISDFPESEAKNELVQLALESLQRRK